MKRIQSPAFLLLIGLASALVGAMLVIMLSMNPPERDIRLLLLFMSSTGILTLSVAYLLYRLGLVRLLPGLRWGLTAMTVVTVVLIFANVWVTAKLMFINPHDLGLTTALLIFGGVMAIAFGLFVANALTDSIRELSGAAERLARGDLNTRLKTQGNDELAELAKTFNWMAESLQEVDQQKRELDRTRRNLVAWVSHDLRTPLTSIRAMVEALADGVVTDPETTARYLNDTRTEIQHLSRLINDLFELAQLDVGRLQLSREITSLRDLLSDTFSSMSVQAREHQVTLKFDVTGDIDPVYIAPDKIQRVLYNLVGNAVRYSSEGSEVTLSAHPANGLVQVEVHNTGVSIPASDLPHIFENFYRGEASRMQSQDGHRGAGLGLAIARGFVEAHGGQIWVESQAERGTTFFFTLPRERDTREPVNPR
jgi:signal transduction histidine kinase